MRQAWLILMLLCLHATAAEAKSLYHSSKQACEQEVCVASPVALVDDERKNCIAKCISPSCFDKIYSAAPLENGEVGDERRKNLFSACVAQEERTQRNWARKQAWDGRQNVSPEEISRRDSDWAAATT